MKEALRNKLLISAALAISLVWLPRCGASSNTLLIKDTPENTDKQVQATLKKFGSIGEVEEKSGYLYGYESGFLHAFDTKVYVGTHTNSSGTHSIVRIESRREDMRVLSDVFSQDFKLENRQYPRTYARKNHIISQSLNLVSPGFSYMYNSYQTPRNDIWSGMLYGSAWLAGDFTLYLFTANAFFFNSQDVFSGTAWKENWAFIAAGMATLRIIHGLDAYAMIDGHNETINLGYKFRL